MDECTSQRQTGESKHGKATRFGSGHSRMLSDIQNQKIAAMPPQNCQTVDGWYLVGSAVEHYSTGTDPNVSRSKQPTVYVKSIIDPATGFGTASKGILAEPYRGKRLRMTAWLKTENVTGWAGIWMRIDGPNRKSLGFDNMQERPLKGTLDWKRYAIVLDVPEESIHVAFGVMLNGNGQIWADDVCFETVSRDVPTTGIPMRG
jgi:hypothetical protein